MNERSVARYDAKTGELFTQEGIYGSGVRIRNREVQPAVGIKVREHNIAWGSVGGIYVASRLKRPEPPFPQCD